MRLDHAAAGAILERFTRSFETFDGDAFTDLFSDDIVFRADAFSEPLAGSVAVRAYLLQASRDRDQLEIVIERHWVDAPTILAAFHGSYVRTSDRARVHLVGSLAAEVGADGRIERYRQWVESREAMAE